ncbi:MAG: tetraacyldisaccharide 4'-kinase [Bacteroidales bacterium]|nr:tetraacyldisaccharide 4'-kinase [Bacteroidales bacterium]
MNFLSFILLPFSFLYGFIVWIRNKLFDWGILRSESFGLPVISVGNLSLGGTGKTPHIEYLIRLLEPEYRIAVLSRGYKRNTRGFRLLTVDSTAGEAGDEPLQVFRKFPGIQVAVSESRVLGVRQLMQMTPSPQVILLDDAFQHRYIRPGLSILLTDYRNLYVRDYVVPSGTLREFRMGARRADMIIVTKTDPVLSPIIRRQIREELKPSAHQKLFFSYLRHEDWQPFPGNVSCGEQKKYYSVLLVAGVANTYPLEQHLRGFCEELDVLRYPDHHRYTEDDMQDILRAYDRLVSRNRVIVTTEKDLGRLTGAGAQAHFRDIPVCYIPVCVDIHQQDRKEFERIIKDYVRKNQGNS